MAGEAASAGKPWIAGQVPSAVVLAAAPPGKQRAVLKDALLRTLEANSARLPPKVLNAFLAAPQPAIPAALAEGPAAAGEAAATLREHLASSARRRGLARL